MKTRKPTVFGDQPARAGDVRLFVNKFHSGFTLIELLVVVALIAVLAALLLPALSRSKTRALAIMCRNNSKQLAYMWTMYSSDNSDKLAYNQAPNAQARSAVPVNVPNWVNNFMDWELTPSNTNLDFLNQSIFASYATGLAAYRCPADHALSDVQKAAGWSSRVRSISMNAMVGDPGTMLQNGVNLNNPSYQQFVRESDFRDPSSVFVFLDEHPDSIDDGYFQNNADVLQWFDLPGSYHFGGGSFSFADGHTEIHRWQSGNTVRPPVPGAFDGPVNVDPNDRVDFDWVIRHMSIPLK